jgi:aminoglycoside phosphotransferase (APT) family kinase protein
LSRQGDDELEQLVRRLTPRGRLVRAWPLGGGVSAQVTALEIELEGGETRKLVLRRHGARDLQRNPRIATDEFRLLEILQAEGIAAPKPCHLDRSGLVVEYIEGGTECAPSDLDDHLGQLASCLARIHTIDGARADLSFLPRQEAERPVLLHGDFWPGNVLWQDGRLIAVIDWDDAAIGDPLADLGTTRLELLWALGSEAMDRFTCHYRAVTTVDLADLPHWDIRAATEAREQLPQWGLAAGVERTMREQLEQFVERAQSAACAPRPGC